MASKEKLPDEVRNVVMSCGNTLTYGEMQFCVTIEFEFDAHWPVPLSGEAYTELVLSEGEVTDLASKQLECGERLPRRLMPAECGVLQRLNDGWHGTGSLHMGRIKWRNRSATIGPPVGSLMECYFRLSKSARYGYARLDSVADLKMLPVVETIAYILFSELSADVSMRSTDGEVIPIKDVVRL